MQLIRACWWAAEKPGENPSRPIGAWPGLRNTTPSAIKLSKHTRSPALTASIQVECTSRIARSSGPICNLRRRTIRSAAGSRGKSAEASAAEFAWPGCCSNLFGHLLGGLFLRYYEELDRRSEQQAKDLLFFVGLPAVGFGCQQNA